MTRKMAAAAAAKFPVLRAVGIDVDEMELSKKKDANKVQRLLGELIRLQQAHSGNKDRELNFFNHSRTNWIQQLSSDHIRMRLPSKSKVRTRGTHT
jgi:hypothetical protein